MFLSYRENDEMSADTGVTIRTGDTDNLQHILLY